MNRVIRKSRKKMEEFTGDWYAEYAGGERKSKNKMRMNADKEIVRVKSRGRFTNRPYKKMWEY